MVVDATQGVQAQTISNLYMAIDHDLEIIPVINKIDMPSAMPEEVEDEIIDLIGCEREDILRASGKTGEGVEDVLEAVVNRVPHPEGDDKAPLQALISTPCSIPSVVLSLTSRSRMASSARVIR